MESVYILSQAETGVTVSCKPPFKIIWVTDSSNHWGSKGGHTKPESLAVQVTRRCPPPACHARHQPQGLCKATSTLLKKFRLTSNSWQTDPFLTLTYKHADTQAVTCLQNALKFLHCLNYGEKLMLGHTAWAPCTHQTAECPRRALPAALLLAPHAPSCPTLQESQFWSHRSQWCRKMRFSAIPLSLR